MKLSNLALKIIGIEIKSKFKLMMFDLENSLKCKADISNQLNKKFAESRTKADKDNAAIKKAEIKSNGLG